MPKGVDTSYKLKRLFFKVGQTNYKEEQYCIYISNIKMKTGLPETRHKLLEEGKFSTTGILFDVNSAVIKPESYGVVKEIALVLMQQALRQKAKVRQNRYQIIKQKKEDLQTTGLGYGKLNSALNRNNTIDERISAIETHKAFPGQFNKQSLTYKLKNKLSL